MTDRDIEPRRNEPAKPAEDGVEVASDERTEAIQSRNIRYAWVLLNYALAGDIIYRGYLLAQDFALYADIFYIWAAANLFFVVLDLATGGMTLRAFKVSAVPAMLIGVIVAAGLSVALIKGANPGLVTLAASVLVLAVVALTALYRRWRRRTEP